MGACINSTHLLKWFVRCNFVVPEWFCRESRTMDRPGFPTTAFGNNGVFFLETPEAGSMFGDVSGFPTTTLGNAGVFVRETHTAGPITDLRTPRAVQCSYAF